ncbi:MAG: response regulator, partial [Planctomycetota bacterium]
MTSQIKVAILEDHQSIIDGYLYRLDQDPEIQVVATQTYGEELESMLSEHTVDVLILDINVPTSGNNPNPYPVVHKIPKILQKFPQLNILVISMYDQASLVKNVMEAGASGFIIKDDRDTIQELASVARSIAKGGIHMSRLAHD